MARIKNKKNSKVKIKLDLILKIAIALYIIFITVFSFDAQSIAGFLIHSLPTLIFTATLILAWKKQEIAGILFILEGLGTIVVFNTYRDLFVLSAVSLIPVLIGILFLLPRKIRKK